MRRILTSPPDLSWEVSRLLPAGRYWHVLGDGGHPGFFLNNTGFHYSDPDSFALSYERTADGFTLTEVKKRSGKQTLAQCPVFFPVENCVERHALMLATRLSCGTDSSCTYRFVIFDSYSPFQFQNQDPPIPGLMKWLMEDWLPTPDLDVKFEKSGVVFDTDQAWVTYISDRFAFIAAEIRSARLPEGFKLRHPLGW